MARTGEKQLRTQIGQFAMVPLWVLEAIARTAASADQDVDAAARAVLVYAWLGARYANRELRAWPKREQLAQAIGISLPTLARALKLLRDAGTLITKRRHAGDGSVLGLDYVLVQVEPDSHQVQSETKDEPDHQIQPDTKDVAAPSVPVGDDGADHRIQPDQSISSSQTQLLGDPDPATISKNKDSSTATPPTGPEPAPEAPKPKTLIEAYHDGFVARFHTKPAINGAKDGRLLKVLTESHGDDRVRQLLDWFFRIRDPFIQNSGYTVGVFQACFNKLQLTYQPADQALFGNNAQYELLKEARRRGEERQKALEAEARAAIVRLSAPARDALKRLIVEEFQRDYPGMATQMKPEAYEAALKSAAVRHVVELCKGGKVIAEVMSQFERSHAA
jgi:hypothetical protein